MNHLETIKKAVEWARKNPQSYAEFVERRRREAEERMLRMVPIILSTLSKEMIDMSVEPNTRVQLVDIAVHVHVSSMDADAGEADAGRVEDDERT